MPSRDLNHTVPKNIETKEDFTEAMSHFMASFFKFNDIDPGKNDIQMEYFANCIKMFCATYHRLAESGELNSWQSFVLTKNNEEEILKGIQMMVDKVVGYKS